MRHLRSFPCTVCWLLVCTSLVISAAVVLIVHGATATRHDVLSMAAGDTVFVPTGTEVQLISNTTPPPPTSACFAFGIRCFTPQSMTAGYNFGPLYASGFNGKAKTIAIIDSFGSPTIADDLHVFDVGFGLQPMCGETGVTCTPDMPTFSIPEVQGSPAPPPQPPKSSNSQKFDVTQGNNGLIIPGYPASQGWDVVTGLGTPNAANLAPDLVASVQGQ
jgi:subtilase family serine protease